MVSWRHGRVEAAMQITNPCLPLVLHRIVCISVFAALGAWRSCLHFLYLHILAAGQETPPHTLTALFVVCHSDASHLAYYSPNFVVRLIITRERALYHEP